MSLPQEFSPDCILSIECRTDCTKTPKTWPSPHILEAVCGKVRIVNDAVDPQIVHFC